MRCKHTQYGSTLRRASRCRGRLQQTRCHTAVCWLILHKAQIQAVRKKLHDQEEQTTERPDSKRKQKTDPKRVGKGATLLAEILDQDFCPSLPAGRVEKDLAAA